MNTPQAKPVREVPLSPTLLRPYAGCWVATIGSQVVGVGNTPHQAWVAARRLRPKEEPSLRYVKRSLS